VLLPVYAGDNAANFRRALASVTTDQLLRPRQLVIVRDGVVSESLERVITDAEALDWLEVSVLRLPASIGLAAALDHGLPLCRFDIVARMDADDISVPERFALQLPVMQAGTDIVGSAIDEIGNDEHRVLATRRVPLTHREIHAAAGYRSPFNHPSVVYRAGLVRAAGGYGDLAHIEDYWLWVRLLHRGARAANLEQSLVRYRVSTGSYKRRGGLRMLRAELRLQKRMFAAGYIGPLAFLRNVLVRGTYRLVPTGVRKLGYRRAFTVRT
jgi:glycosyltransferase involved in cell wall biosynthesis